MASYKFGTATVSGKSDWLVQSISTSNEGQEAMALDNVGEPKAYHVYQKTETVSLEVIIPEDDSTFPEIGDVFTLNGTKFFVSSVSLTENNTDFNRYSLSCKRFTSANLPN